MKHLWIVLGQVPHCPAGWATAILECSYNEWVYLTFNSVWAGDSCQVESTSMPGPEFFFFFSRSTPHCNKTINVNQLACQWFLCSGWLGTCMHKESHTYASTHTYTHTPTNTHIKALRILGYWQTAYTPLWVPMPWVKLSDTFHTGSTYTTLSPWGLHWRCPFANNSIMDTHLQCLDAHAFLNTHTHTRMHIRDHVHTME